MEGTGRQLYRDSEGTCNCTHGLLIAGAMLQFSFLFLINAHFFLPLKMCAFIFLNGNLAFKEQIQWCCSYFHTGIYFLHLVVSKMKSQSLRKVWKILKNCRLVYTLIYVFSHSLTPLQAYPQTAHCKSMWKEPLVLHSTVRCMPYLSAWKLIKCSIIYSW